MGTFDFPGVLHPTKYAWKKQFAVATGVAKKENAPFISFDSKKLVGLFQYCEELEDEVKKLRDENVKLKEVVDKDLLKKKDQEINYLHEEITKLEEVKEDLSEKLKQSKKR